MSIDTIKSKFIRKVPQAIIKDIYINIEKYNMCFSDALDNAFRNYPAKKNSEIYKAWYYSDFRAFCPSICSPEYLDFEKYPLAYSVM